MMERGRESKQMAGTIEAKLSSLGIVLPAPAAPVANYVGFVRTGNLVFVSGQLCFDAQGKLTSKGKLGAGVSIEEGAAAARLCGVNLIAHVKAAIGDLDKVVRVVRLGGFVNSVPDFIDAPKVVNGASDLMVAVFGDKGRHSRAAVGVASLPADASVEIEGTFEVA
jgi:enamine deaminase RidA (YjgF/YER057c/UK114 family)